MKKKLLPIILVCCMLSAWLAAYAHADDIVARGDCSAEGSNVLWTLDNRGNLTISGTGEMVSWGGSPWSNHSNMIISATVNEGVTNVSSGAFSSLNRLTRITLPDSIFIIEWGAFRGCSNLLSLAIPDHVTSIGDGAFEDCDSLTEMLIPHNVRSLGAGAFNGCNVLQSVTMLADTPIINAYTFSSCPALREITIPDSVTIIGEGAFSDCYALRDVYFTGTESMWNNITINSGNQPLTSANIHYNSPNSIEGTLYRINSLSISDMFGNPLTEIPNGVFLQTVSVTNRASGGSPLIFVAAYSADGQFQNYAYVTVKEPVGGTVEVTLPVDNSGGNIAQLKAF
ncbi:MAG: leucine-rich repeat domain-containing protein, partial [Oscillibacter sp.]|nr:leucine-rich repeat domain-containing protein [Oscillibacter sp.]